MRQTMLLSLLALACNACQETETSAELIEANDTSIPELRADTEISADTNSQWRVDIKPDPLNDDAITTVSRRFISGSFSLEVAASCGNKQPFSYDFTAFDRDGNSASYKWTYQGGKFHDGWYTQFYLRIDQDDPAEITYKQDRYENNIGLNKMNGRRADYRMDRVAFPYLQAAKADQLAIRFKLRNGDATVVVDQTPPLIRNVLNDCIKLHEPALVTEPPQQPEHVVNGAGITRQSSDINPQTYEASGTRTDAGTETPEWNEF